MWLKSALAVALLATATKLLVTAFHHDADNKELRCGRGWRWVEVAGGDTITLTSPNYPAAYDYYRTCGWNFLPTSRNVILKLRCDSFHLQESNKHGICPDFLRVQRKKHCGTSKPVITATNITKLGISFHSNGRLNYPGFRCTLTATNPNIQRCVCGDTDGREAAEAPWVSSLVFGDDSQPYCSASVVRERWVLTSATCAARIKYNKHNYAVIVGAGQGGAGKRLPIRRVFLHPASLFGLPRSDANLALIHLKEPVDFRGGVARPVCLPLSPAHHRPALGFEAWQGWRGSEVEKQECLSEGHRGDAWLCGRPADLCRADEGDLGSPLVSRSQGEGGAVQVGVAVVGDGCIGDQHTLRNLGPHSPAVYISVIRHLPWINQVLGRDNTCPYHD
ncbi:serine protease 30-like [Eriocheir sinensis]|uniref:serine protease 30-like n=1 Tax=Eriocheir sinensis TaxID=95602 RepID=UPI0021C81405|nr:serine protease 30-like [Eriocheir sinensis]